MRKVVLLEHVSLDGFVSGPNGEMDWIRFDDDLVDYFAPLTDNADSVIFGRVTYQMMAGYWPTAAEKPGATRHDIDHARWVNAATKLVFSRTLTELTWRNSRLISEDIGGAMAEIKRQAGRNLMMYGSAALAKEFMQLGLIDEFRLNVNPVILGAGTPLFGKSGPIDLNLTEAKTFASGVVGLCYNKV